MAAGIFLYTVNISAMFVIKRNHIGFERLHDEKTYAKSRHRPYDGMPPQGNGYRGIQ